MCNLPGNGENGENYRMRVAAFCRPFYLDFRTAPTFRGLLRLVYVLGVKTVVVDVFLRRACVARS